MGFQVLDAIALIEYYCKSKAPYEAGGYVSTSGEFVPCENVHHDPVNYFRFADVPSDATAIIHSHPGGPFCPTEADQRAQMAWGIPWAIVAFDDVRTELFWFGDEVEPLPLVGRGFRHYVADCYRAIRDAYKFECGLELGEWPREWRWWLSGAALYEHGFPLEGFREIPLSDVRAGDAVLMSLRSKTPNHAALWLGAGLIYHHMSGKTESEPGRLSTVEYAGRYQPYIVKALRNDDSRIDRAFGEKIRSLVSL